MVDFEDAGSKGNSLKDKGKMPSSVLKFSAWTGLFWESLWPRLVPVFLIACVFFIFSWLGGWAYLSAFDAAWVRWGVLALFGIAGLVGLRPLLELNFPTPSAITRRIESRSRLQDRPLTAQEDVQATGSGDPFAQALWREHQKRMADRLKHMTAGAPKPDANRFDPFAVRAALPVLAFVAFLFSFSGSGGKLADSVFPPTDRESLLTRLDVWINPPAYTKKPPLYLSARTASLDPNGDSEPKAVIVPQSSEFYLRFVGNSELTLNYEIGAIVQPIRAMTPDDGVQKQGEVEFKFELLESGTVKLVSNGTALAQWPISIVPDQPPEIHYESMPTAALSGSLQLNYSVADDYGVVSADAEIKSTLEVEPDARPLVQPPKIGLPLPRQRAKSGKSKVNRDLTKHPWAGSEVEITLVARDDAKQEGRSVAHRMILPGRRFSKPLALALIEQRRILALDANKVRRVADLLDAVSSVPEEYINNVSAQIAMRVAYRRMVSARDDDQLRETLDLLWDIALAVEFGDLSEAERRLREAQERLSEALENDASQEEIDRLMKELREAMNEFMRQMIEQARNNPLPQNPFDQNQMNRNLSQRDLDRMMDQIENLAKSGSRDRARELLAEMQRMMDNLRAGRHQQQRQAEGNELNQALDKLSELMQRQQELMNETFNMQRRNPANRQQGQQQGRQQQGQQQQGQQQGQQNQSGQRQQNQAGQSGPMTPEEFAEALKRLQQQQEALRQQLGELGQRLEGMGLDPSEGFGEAENQMGQAGENLQSGQPGDATGNQAQALEALRQGAQQMMQQMAGDRQQGGQQAGQQGQGNDQRRRMSDPLGRARSGEGFDVGQDTRVPDEIDAQRAREILEAIRRRLSIPTQPFIEKDYLERLLRSR